MYVVCVCVCSLVDVCGLCVCVCVCVCSLVYVCGLYVCVFSLGQCMHVMYVCVYIYICIYIYIYTHTCMHAYIPRTIANMPLW